MCAGSSRREFCQPVCEQGAGVPAGAEAARAVGGVPGRWAPCLPTRRPAPPGLGWAEAGCLCLFLLHQSSLVMLYKRSHAYVGDFARVNVLPFRFFVFGLVLVSLISRMFWKMSM